MVAAAPDEILSRPVNEWVRRFRLLPDRDTRTRELQRLIGPPSMSPEVLQRRALLVTALERNGLWPARHSYT